MAGAGGRCRPAGEVQCLVKVMWGLSTWRPTHHVDEGRHRWLVLKQVRLQAGPPEHMRATVRNSRLNRRDSDDESSDFSD